MTAIPDAKKGERIIVLHIPLTETNPKDMWKKLNERGLPNIYVPSQRDFYQVAELPVLGSGKLDLKKCKQMARSRSRGRRLTNSPFMFAGPDERQT